MIHNDECLIIVNYQYSYLLKEYSFNIDTSYVHHKHLSYNYDFRNDNSYLVIVAW